MKLQEIFGLDDINDLPIIYNIAWYEQKGGHCSSGASLTRYQEYPSWTDASGIFKSERGKCIGGKVWNRGN